MHDRCEDLSQRRALLDRHRAGRSGGGLPLLRRVVRLDVRGREPPDAPGYYLIAQLDGQDVAGIGLRGRSRRTRGTPTWRWTTPTRSPTRRTRPGAHDQPSPGRRSQRPDAGFVDPTGAAFRVWQPRQRPGAQAVNCPGRGTSATCTPPTRHGQGVLRRGVRLGGRRARFRGRSGGDDVAPARLRGPSRRDRRSGHLPPPRRRGRTPGVRRCHRLAGPARQATKPRTGT